MSTRAAGSPAEREFRAISCGPLGRIARCSSRRGVSCDRRAGGGRSRTFLPPPPYPAAVRSRGDHEIDHVLGWAASEPGGGRHRAAAGRADLGQLERSAGRAQQQPLPLRSHAARLRPVVALRHPRGDDAEEVAVGQRDPCADVRPQRPHGPLELLRRARRVERAVGGLDLVRVRDLRLVLVHEARPLVQRSHEQLAAEPLEADRERPVVVVAADRLRLLQAHRAGVEALGDAHDRDAGGVVAGHDRPLHGRRPAPARQQRRMHVDHLVGRQQRLLDQHTVGADARDLRRDGGDSVERLGVVQPLGLDHLEAEITRPHGHRRRRHLPPPPSRPVRPRDDERRAVRAVGEPFEHDGGELRGAEVDRAHEGSGRNGAVRR